MCLFSSLLFPISPWNSIFFLSLFPIFLIHFFFPPSFPAFSFGGILVQIPAFFWGISPFLTIFFPPRVEPIHQPGAPWSPTSLPPPPLQLPGKFPKKSWNSPKILEFWGMSRAGAAPENLKWTQNPGIYPKFLWILGIFRYGAAPENPKIPPKSWELTQNPWIYQNPGILGRFQGWSCSWKS